MRSIFAMIAVIFLTFGCADFVLIDSTNTIAEETKFDADQAFAYLEKQCDFGERFPGSTAHRKTRDFLFSELKKFSDHVELQNFTFEEIEMTNILARFGSGNEKILLAAHWDTRPFADRDPDPKHRNRPIIGANDGASGVAVLLEIARNLHKNPPDRQVFIVLFDGEDYGKTADRMFLGSTHFSKNMDDWRADYGILLDMIGDKNLQIPIEYNSWNAAQDLCEAVWTRAEKLGFSEFVRRVGPAIMDDHLPLIRAGVPTIDLIDFDYPYWHTIEDTPDKCSAESLLTVGSVVLDLVMHGLD